jgi:hypothetical protein
MFEKFLKFVGYLLNFWIGPRQQAKKNEPQLTVTFRMQHFVHFPYITGGIGETVTGHSIFAGTHK